MNIEHGTYLCPNDHLLGRASVKVTSGDFDHDNKTKKRLDFIQRLVNKFWIRWQRDYFSNY